jgi:hypothetical protein
VIERSSTVIFLAVKQANRRHTLDPEQVAEEIIGILGIPLRSAGLAPIAHPG